MTSKRFKRDDWLDFGLARLAADGPEALRLQTLCAAANKTIGSFYHHFQDQSAFFQALMEHWRKINSTDVIAQVDTIPDAHKQAEKLEVIATTMDQKIEVGVRNFAFQNVLAAEILAQVDQTRISYLCDLYQKRLNMGKSQARALAELEYAAFVGVQMIWQGGTVEHGQTLSDLFQSMITSHFTPR